MSKVDGAGGAGGAGEAGGLSIIPVRGIPEIEAGMSLATLIAEAADRGGTPLRSGDCLVVTQKVVSKVEGRVVSIDSDDADARRELVEQESVRVLRRRGDLIISETRHGFVCANAGVDISNIPDGFAALLPVDSDRSARGIRLALRAQLGVEVAVIVSDTFGRAWRNGLVDVAIGMSGLTPILDLRGTSDAGGRPLAVTEIAIADELASAAELVMGKATGVPAAIIRGLDLSWFNEGSARALVRPPSEDLFR